MNNKFIPTSRKVFLLGFDEFNCNYLIFDYESHRIVNVHDVTSKENDFPEREDNDPTTFLIEEEEETHTETEPTSKTNQDNSEDNYQSFQVHTTTPIPQLKSSHQNPLLITRTTPNTSDNPLASANSLDKPI
ncbi:hypothetical protein Pst134EA_007339 [Puccinia striiformis f. sp. tritici]|uniref:hypothetical protein n=1 Tax=Puccinia striiformis f. sp. tritici TaxID=168172 RepID=UPI000A129229|nr:hypothetical protein Pst134EA_007339 [Puccinia striiformis f. sp. tritici]KAH9470073.1 hypothetical protein Pst134EA_007339 [Puccinia striiformis f. sp. tritici]KAI9626741.1 hypothetical protein KEM48_010205 [Puccinia striiformis f. sp. tritici PST-130]KAI9626742.1 hypothetical protein KEM48_010206 [Puccinia striiformis f. sp. tritici PST-130]KAI9626743.1 hypothetical protein KEM48_010207 [Puccinia striiformis f. sp. tritici PST-130]